MSCYLDDNPPRRRQSRSPRRASPTGCIVIHTAENPPDFKSPDMGAERVARFIVGRRDVGSYHTIVDSDSAIRLISFADEAFHDGTGSNRWSIGLSVATKASMWDWSPQWWVDAAVNQLADAAAEANMWLVGNGFPPCPPRLITKAESDAGEAGFISHAARDPQRRTDPGADFPWQQFLDRYAVLVGGEGDMVSAHSDAALGTLAITSVYDTFGDRRIDSAESFGFQLRRYLTSDDPAQVLVALAAELEAEP